MKQIFCVGAVLLMSHQCAAEKDVGIYYWTWFPDAWSFGAWGQPQLGYYRSDDTNIIDQHCEQLVSAGIDFVLIDWSNNCLPYGDPNNPNFLETYTKSFVQRLYERKTQGKAYLQFAIMLGTCANANYITDGHIYSKAQQVNDWFLATEYNFLYYRYRRQVPFLGLFAITMEQEAEAFNHPAFWTRVIGGGLSGRHLVDGSFGSRYMTYEDRWEPVPSYDDLYANEGHTEQTVQVGCRGPGGWNDPNGRRTRDNGTTFTQWWDEACSRNVNLALVHSWNEWGGPGEQLNQECSTDIEPMSGGHGTYYLSLLADQVARFKGQSQQGANMTRAAKQLSPEASGRQSH